MNLVPNINAKTFTLSAVTIGFLLIDELTPAEQNSLLILHNNKLLITEVILLHHITYILLTITI